MIAFVNISPNITASADLVVLKDNWSENWLTYVFHETEVSRSISRIGDRESSRGNHCGRVAERQL